MIGTDTVAKWYEHNLTERGLHPDPIQAAVVEHLQELADKLVSSNEQGGSFSLLGHLFGTSRKSNGCRGMYIHGRVGRGKSFLMDGFYLNVPRTDKLRVHFHGFMRHFHNDMKAYEGKEGGLEQVAGNLADRYRLLCFDEFHVTDITDAMILGRILEVLLERGVVVVATSNYAPDDLYPNGLARDRFLPTIGLIKERFDICSLDGEVDYRLRALENAGLYISPDDAAARQRFEDLFGSLAIGMELPASFKLGSRRLPAIRRTSDAIWLDFEEVCGGAYGKNDYLQIAERFTTVFVSGVPRLGTEKTGEQARRFTWLVEVLYDSKVKLVLLAEKALADLYIGEGGESGRTLSRLEEMQSKEYLREAVRDTSADLPAAGALA